MRLTGHVAHQSTLLSSAIGPHTQQVLHTVPRAFMTFALLMSVV